MASVTFNAGSLALQNGGVNWAADDIEVILVDDSYVANQDDVAANIVAVEVAGVTGYVGGFGGAGRKLLAGKTLTDDAVNNRTKYDAADPSAWTLGAGVNVRGAVIAARGSVDDTDMVPLFFVELADDVPTNGGTFTLAFHADGIAYTQQ